MVLTMCFTLLLNLPYKIITVINNSHRHLLLMKILRHKGIKKLVTSCKW